MLLRVDPQKLRDTAIPPLTREGWERQRSRDFLKFSGNLREGRSPVYGEEDGSARCMYTLPAIPVSS